MFWQIFTYELKYKFSRLSTYIYWLVLFLFMFLIISALGGNVQNVSVTIGGLGGKVHTNSPYIIYILTTGLSYMAMILLPAIFGTSIYKDFKNNMHSILFAYPLSKFGYLGGRFMGAFLTTIFIFSGMTLGYMAAIQMPWIDTNSLGTFRLDAYLHPFITTIIPNLLITGLFIFSLASLTRELLATYVGCIAIIVLYGIGNTLMTDIDNQVVASLVDPLGSAAFELSSKYWTVNEKNTQLLPVTWYFFGNRLIWLTIAGGIFAMAFRKFKFTQNVFTLKIRKRSRILLSKIQPVFKYQSIKLPKVKRDFSTGSRSKQFLSLTKNEFKNIIRNPYFLAILLTAIIMLTINAGQIGKMFGTTTFPVTYKVTEMLGNSFYLFMIIIITFYAGEMVWRERDNKIDGIINTMPLPNWMLYTSKLSALMALGIFLMLVVMIFGIFVQIFKGYFNFQIGLYLSELGILYLDFLLLGILAVAIHTLVNNKYAGHFIMVAFYVFNMFMSQFGMEHTLYKYASDPGMTYSAMNGYGHFVGPFLIYKAYWASFAIILGILSNLFWVRGSESGRQERINLMRKRITKPVVVGFSLALAGFIGLGGIIFYNTNVLNDFTTTKERREKRAEYEKKYNKYADILQPRITDVNVNLDIYPDKRDFYFDGYYIIKNKTSKPIDSLIISQNNETQIRKMEFNRETNLIQKDKEMGFYIYKLTDAIAPGDSVKLKFKIDYITKGFKHRGSNTDIIKNGTFIHSNYIPSIGYNAAIELSNNKTREKFGLKHKKPIASIDDSNELMDTYIAQNSDWVNFETTVSTTKDQIAIAPGYLINKWEKNGRMYYHYKMDSKVLNFFAWLSADYQVKKDTWNEVDISVYYQEGHEYNVDNMIHSVKKSLDYYTTNFSPYQYRQVRILEFPRFASYAQAFPNTIPFSESIGFIADVDHDDINYPFWITAHEMAHQWWAHQVIGGNVEGCTVMSEVLAQYSSTMVMEKEFGKPLIKDFMDHNQDRYLQGRTNEKIEETPLIYVRPDQGYIHYGKGCVAMYSLQDYLGEDTINKAIRNFTEKYAFQEPPFVTSLDFLRYIEEVTPDSLMYFTNDWFNRIVLYENKVNSFETTETEEGKFKVKLNLETHKYEADSLGNEKEIPLNDWIDVGIYATTYKEGKFIRDTLHLQKHKFSAPKTKLEFVLDKKPTKVAIDPLYKLIDRHRDDNYKSKTVTGIL